MGGFNSQGAGYLLLALLVSGFAEIAEEIAHLELRKERRISRLTVSKIRNHAETGVTAIYDRHSYDQKKREALTAWSERLIEMSTHRDESELLAG